MATWKKLIVSGSNISQLLNDSGYLTSASSLNAFSTASYDGVSLLADNSEGNLTFASGSGTGLLISASAANDTLTFSLSAIPNNSLANSAITIAGISTSLGGSITQSTILSGSNVWSGSAQLPSGIVSSSLLSSPGQGQALLTTNGVAGSTVDLGLEIGDSPTFAGVTGGNVTVGITTDNTIGTTSGNLTVTSTGGLITVPVNLSVTGNLTVEGTASFQNTQNLDVADRFIRLASGSTTFGDGGIVIQQTSSINGEAFAYDYETLRWGIKESFDATAATISPDAFMAAVLVGADAIPTTVGARYQTKGNIFVGTDEAIWIYS